MMPHPSPRSSLAAGMLIAGKYRLIRRLGSGAMGVVWAAINETTGREVALKIILSQRDPVRRRVQREARACGAVRHPNVIDIHDVVQTDEGDPVLVLQLLQGETLADLLMRRRRLEPRLAARIGGEIAAALTAIHGAGIVHRDLKPANIFLHRDPLCARPAVKLLDFGVSKRVDRAPGGLDRPARAEPPSADDEANPCTAPGNAVGSLHYMSPEQIRTDPDVDPRADLWALGVVLFEMLTGERPFHGGFSEVATQIVQGESPRVCRLVRHVDPVLVELVACLMRRDRAHRLGPAELVMRELDRLAGGDDPWGAPPSSGPITVRSAVPGARPEDQRGAMTRIMPALLAIDARPAGAERAQPAQALPEGARTRPGFGDPGSGWITPQEPRAAAPSPPAASGSRSAPLVSSWPVSSSTDGRGSASEGLSGWRAPSAAPYPPMEARRRSAAHLAALSALLVLGAASVLVSAMTPPATPDLARTGLPAAAERCSATAAPPRAPARAPHQEGATLDATMEPPAPRAPDAGLPAQGAEPPSVRCVEPAFLDHQRCTVRP